MKRGVVKVSACCLAGNAIYESTGLTAYEAGEMQITGNGAVFIECQERMENYATK